MNRRRKLVLLLVLLLFIFLFGYYYTGYKKEKFEQDYQFEQLYHDLIKDKNSH